MIDDEFKAIEDAAKAATKAQAWVPGRSWVAEAQRHVLDEYIAAVGPHVTLALVAEVRRLRALQCVRMVSGEEPLFCHEHGWVPDDAG